MILDKKIEFYIKKCKNSNQKSKFSLKIVDMYLQKGVCTMGREEKLTFREDDLNKLLRDEMFANVEDISKIASQVRDIREFEMISETEKPYVSPIFSMNEDEILAFVEEFDVNELKTLSVAELNHIGKVLGVDPMILAEGEG